MNQFYTQKLAEDKEKEYVSLNNEEITVGQFNKTLESLEHHQRVIETSDKNFHIIERMFG